jgi:hypothetical protein
MQRQPRHSADFKAQVALEALQGRETPEQLAMSHGLSVALATALGVVLGRLVPEVVPWLAPLGVIGLQASQLVVMLRGSLKRARLQGVHTVCPEGACAQRQLHRVPCPRLRPRPGEGPRPGDLVAIASLALALGLGLCAGPP